VFVNCILLDRNSLPDLNTCIYLFYLQYAFYHMPSSYEHVVVQRVNSVPLRHVGAKEERKYSLYLFLASALYGLSGQYHAPAGLYPRERTPGTRWLRDWVGLGAGLDTGTINNSFRGTKQ
jgi:hypothetical protein